MTPHQVLDSAVRLLDGPAPSMRRCWQRSCACLTRVALEQALDDYWIRAAPSLIHRPMRHQLAVLPSFAGSETARSVSAVWNDLSRAMHHHAYELPPTIDELQDWHQSVSRLMIQLGPDHADGSS